MWISSVQCLECVALLIFLRNCYLTDYWCAQRYPTCVHRLIICSLQVVTKNIILIRMIIYYFLKPAWLYLYYTRIPQWRYISIEYVTPQNYLVQLSAMPERRFFLLNCYLAAYLCAQRYQLVWIDSSFLLYKLWLLSCTSFNIIQFSILHTI